MDSQLETALRDANPVRDDDADPQLHGLVRMMAASARMAAASTSSVRTPWWKRRRAMLPLGVVGVAALTGAAVAIPLSLAVNGTWVDLDAQFPIVYITDTGVDVTCKWGVYVGVPGDRTPTDEALAAFFKNHDWTGIGQRIYDHAIAEPFVPGPDDYWESDTPEARDSASFFQALNFVIWDEVPEDLQVPYQSTGGTSDCTGQLH